MMLNASTLNSIHNQYFDSNSTRKYQSQWHKRLLKPLAAVPFVASLGFSLSPALAEDNEIPFSEAELFFELNNTDGDLGIHAFIDGGPWKHVHIEDLWERKILGVNVFGRLRRQGLNELFIESAEPSFDELPPEKFFQRFPQGVYEAEGRTLKGREIESEMLLTHVMPSPPVVTINGQPAAASCDEDDLPVIPRGTPITISWQPVTLSHPDIGEQNVAIDVINYEVVTEIDETRFDTSAVLPPEVTSFRLPRELMRLTDVLKFEVKVREKSYNQTGVESCFCIDECPEDDDSSISRS